MGTVLLRLLTLIEIILFIKHFKEQHKHGNDLQQRWHADSIHPEDQPPRSYVLDDVPIEKRGYTDHNKD